MVDDIKEKPFRMQEWVFLSMGLGGILLGTIFLALFNTSSRLNFWVIRDIVLNAAMLALAVAVLLGVLYFISVKHNHQRLHKLFFLVSSIVVGVGAFLLLTSFIMLFLIVTQEMLYTIVGIVLLAGIFAVSIVFTELTYVLLRRRYEDIPPKDPGKLFFWAIGVGIIAAVILVFAAWGANNALVGSLQRGAMQLHKDMPSDPNATVIISSVENELLREQLLADQQEGTLELKPPTLYEVITDDVFATRCPEWAAFWASTTYRAISVQTASSYLEFKRLNVSNFTYADPSHDAGSLGKVAVPIRYKPTDDMIHCTQQLMNSVITRHATLIGDQSTPEQKELAQYFAWRQARLS